MYRFNKADNALADAYFRRAVDLDPGFARAYGALSFTSFQSAFLRYGATGRQRSARRATTRSGASTSIRWIPS